MARTPKPDVTDATLVCAACFPTGPPEGATSVGCEHGEWDVTTATVIGVGVVPSDVAAAAVPADEPTIEPAE